MAMSTPSTQGAAGLSYAVGTAAAGMMVWGLSLCHVQVPAEQAGECAFLIGVAVHHFFGPKVATSATITATVEK